MEKAFEFRLDNRDRIIVCGMVATCTGFVQAYGLFQGNIRFDGSGVVSIIIGLLLIIHSIIGIYSFRREGLSIFADGQIVSQTRRFFFYPQKQMVPISSLAQVCFNIQPISPTLTRKSTRKDLGSLPSEIDEVLREQFAKLSDIETAIGACYDLFGPLQSSQEERVAFKEQIFKRLKPNYSMVQFEHALYPKVMSDYFADGHVIYTKIVKMEFNNTRGEQILDFYIESKRDIHKFATHFTTLNLGFDFKLKNVIGI